MAESVCVEDVVAVEEDVGVGDVDEVCVGVIV